MKKFLKSWYGILIVICFALLIMFAGFAIANEYRRPSENISNPVLIKKELPQDTRKISILDRSDSGGFIIAYGDKDELTVLSTDTKAKVKKENSIKLDINDFRLVFLTEKENGFIAYYGDRVSMYSVFIDKDLNISTPKLFSNHAEQFAVDGDFIITGDDSVLEIYKNEILIETVKGIESYNDLLRVGIVSDGVKAYFGFNNDLGGFIGVVDGDKVEASKIQTSEEQAVYGYFADMTLNKDFALVTHRVDALSQKPTSMQVFNINKDTLEVEEEFIITHNRTSLAPKLIEVDGSYMRYVIGNPQTFRNKDELELMNPEFQGGMYTNISLYERDKEKLLKNTRFTFTRDFPMGYFYFEKPEGDVLFFADKVKEHTNLILVGVGQEWIEYGRKNTMIDAKYLSYSITMDVISTIFIGSLITFVKGLNYMLYILGFGIIMLVIMVTIKREWKWKLFFILLTIGIIAMRLHMNLVYNDDIVAYSMFYNKLLANKAYLALAAIIPGTVAYILYKMWAKKNTHASNLMGFFMIVWIEYVVYMLMIVIYLNSAMVMFKQLL